MVGGIRFEHTHRVIAGFVGLLTLALTLWAIFREKRAWVRGLTILAFFMVTLQAVLGGITVIHRLPDAVSITHACLAQTFFALLGVITLVTSESWSNRRAVFCANGASFKRLLGVTCTFVYLQLIAGAAVRHTEGAAGLPYHILLAFLILLHTFLIFYKVTQDKNLSERWFKPAGGLAILVFIQAMLGFAAYVVTLALRLGPDFRFEEVLITTAHQAIGAWILMAMLVWTLSVFRHLES